MDVAVGAPVHFYQVASRLRLSAFIPPYLTASSRSSPGLCRPLSLVAVPVAMLFIIVFFAQRCGDAIYARIFFSDDGPVHWRASSPRVEVTRAVLNQGKRFVAVMALDTGEDRLVTSCLPFTFPDPAI